MQNHRSHRGAGIHARKRKVRPPSSNLCIASLGSLAFVSFALQLLCLWTVPDGDLSSSLLSSSQQRTKTRLQGNQTTFSSTGSRQLGPPSPLYYTLWDSRRRDEEEAGDRDAYSYISTRRIRGYDDNRTNTLFGYVMGELADRILSRKIAQSSVVVVSPQASSVTRWTQNVRPAHWDIDEAQRAVRHRVGESFVLHAAHQGHNVYGFDGSLDSHWFGHQFQNKTAPQWILLSVFDPIPGQEDRTMQAAREYLQRSTATYIVFSVSAWFDDSSDWKYPWNSRKRYGGIKAVEILQDLGYKVQVLSHSHDTRPGTTPATPKSFKPRSLSSWFPPNTILRPAPRISFSWPPHRWFASGIHVTHNILSYLDTGLGMIASSGGPRVFRAYLFATQGLDMAIPHRQNFFNDSLFRDQTVNQETGAIEWRENGIPFFSCQDRKPIGSLQFASDHILPVCSEARVRWDPSTVLSNQQAMWQSSARVQDSEAACIRCSLVHPPSSKNIYYKEMMPLLAKNMEHGIWGSDVVCNTRVIPEVAPIAQPNPHRKNLLLIMLDPISRSQFDTFLPRTKQLLESWGLVSFNKYTAVGDNSGPNQAALYSGLPLANREGISKTSSSWIWDDLRQARGYATLKAEDGCILNSNMVQSIKPNTTHGQALHELFCFDFQRPNCLGHQSASEWLAQYAEQFIEEYERQHRPWAAFLSFIDGHEDTGILGGSLDGTLVTLLKSVRGLLTVPIWDDVTLVITSDHGLHYGPHFQSYTGHVERTQPVLHLKLPRAVQEECESVLADNANLHTTPFDVHKTLTAQLMGQDSQSPHGLPLTDPLPFDTRSKCHKTKEIPGRYCSLWNERITLDKEMALALPSPPSLLSFFADIPRQNREVFMLGNNENYGHNQLISRWSSTKKECHCATETMTWFPCDEKFKVLDSHASAQFLLKDCPDELVSIEHRRRGHTNTARSTSNKKSRRLLPSIVFLEIDSVSERYADRFFPLTRDLLSRHRIRRENGQYVCGPTGLCSADFSSHFTLTGRNSIPNQISALAGCLYVHPMLGAGPRSCGRAPRAPIGSMCQEPGNMFVNMTATHTFREITAWCPLNMVDRPNWNATWIFSIARDLGYKTMFGEEFCFEGSPYTLQGNIFPVSVDVMPHKAFCRLAERTILRDRLNTTMEDRWRVEKMDEPCLDGFKGYEKARISLDQIHAMFDTEVDTPKFIYVNAIAAHTYNPDPSKMVMRADRYDKILHDFLQDMFARSEERNNTIFIVRSDHGLQGGPFAVEHDVQVEQIRPWTEIVVPERFPGLSKAALFVNQERLATGFDLYSTLRHAMKSADRPGTPSFSFNLFSDIVPLNRTCKEARVFEENCRETSRHMSLDIPR